MAYSTWNNLPSGEKVFTPLQLKNKKQNKTKTVLEIVRSIQTVERSSLTTSSDWLGDVQVDHHSAHSKPFSLLVFSRHSNLRRQYLSPTPKTNQNLNQTVQTKAGDLNQPEWTLSQPTNSFDKFMPQSYQAISKKMSLFPLSFLPIMCIWCCYFCKSQLKVHFSAYEILY